jgi:serine/threonine-protein kinase
MIHRDVKPANLLLHADGAVRLTDFGLMRAADPSTLSRITAEGQVVGTLPYLAPEQYRDSRTGGAASDLYSLGATLYHLLAGEPPFLGESFAEIGRKLSAGATPRLGRTGCRCAPEVVALVDRLLAADPTARGGSALDLQRELEALGRAGGGDP